MIKTIHILQLNDLCPLTLFYRALEGTVRSNSDAETHAQNLHELVIFFCMIPILILKEEEQDKPI